MQLRLGTNAKAGTAARPHTGKAADTYRVGSLPTGGGCDVGTGRREQRREGSGDLLQNLPVPRTAPGQDAVTSPSVRLSLSRTGAAVLAPAYRWRWSRRSDRVTVRDADGRVVVTFPLQPTVQVTGSPSAIRPGRCGDAHVHGACLVVRYDGVNGGGRLTLRLRFAEDHLVLEQTLYEPAGDEAVVRLTFFARPDAAGMPRPAARAHVCIVPGGRQDPEQAIFQTARLREVAFSTGCSGMGTGTFHQQWALPHFLVACYRAEANGRPTSGAACVGLGGFPDGAALVRVHRGRFAYELRYRGDLWGHRRGPGSVRFDTPLVMAVAADWMQCMATYVAALRTQGYAPAPRAHLPQAAFYPQYDTWGDQATRRCLLSGLDERCLRGMLADLLASGLRPRLFVIDDQWEERYGSFRHDARRLPHFQEFLDEVRSHGMEIGLWTAFARCQDPRALGLSDDALLQGPDGRPFTLRIGKRSWCLFDPTSPEAVAYLREAAHALVSTYRPRLLKLDFGYELPTPDLAAPHDPTWAGERLFRRLLEVFVGAVRQADPDVAILYYALSPLVADLVDLCALDDLWMSRGRYHGGFARRAFLASLCGVTGLVPYGSSGYDWRSAKDIWMDTAVIGVHGVIAPLAGDEYDGRPTPALAARFNGITRILRRRPQFRILPLDAEVSNPALGPRARSWARVEQNGVVVAVLRPRPDAPAELPGVARATAPVVLASPSDKSIATSERLLAVPFGDGELVLSRTAGARARATLADGRHEPVAALQTSEGLLVPLSTTSADGLPVEAITLEWH